MAHIPHRTLVGYDNHILSAFSYANAALRTGALGLIAADVGKLAHQTDNNTFWILLNHSPVTWRQAVFANVTDDAQIKASDFPALSVDGEVALFSGITGKSLKRAAISAVPYLTAGVMSASNVTNDAQLKRAANDFTSFANKVLPVGADVFLIEDSANGYAKKNILGSSFSPGFVPFGSDSQYSSSEGISSTTSSGWQNKVTMVVPARTGTYRLQFYCGLSVASTNKGIALRLYNTTDAVELCSTEEYTGKQNVWQNTGGFVYVTFTGVGKTFTIDFNSPDNNTQVSVRRTRLEMWRIQ
jgi:hypothetical protein